MKKSKKLFDLIEKYLSNKISSWDFCDEFHSCFDLQLPDLELSKKEYKSLSYLGDIVGRFTDVKEDIERFPTFYSTEKDLIQAVTETKNKLLSLK